jgi:tRNA-(ms[2]io[6]A)-hydroxylase
MARLSIQLGTATERAWGDFIAAHFDEFLVDHANCERKASAFAMGLIVKYPDRPSLTDPLINIAREELEHFHRVFKLMSARSLTVGPDQPDPYVAELNGLARHGRDERLMDRLLLAGIIEARGAERFALVAEALKDASLRQFYHQLAKSEKKHAQQFIVMLRPLFAESTLAVRLEQLLAAEGAIAAALPWRAALH